MPHLRDLGLGRHGVRRGVPRRDRPRLGLLNHLRNKLLRGGSLGLELRVRRRRVLVRVLLSRAQRSQMVEVDGVELLLPYRVPGDQVVPNPDRLVRGVLFWDRSADRVGAVGRVGVPAGPRSQDSDGAGNTAAAAGGPVTSSITAVSTGSTAAWLFFLPAFDGIGLDLQDRFIRVGAPSRNFAGSTLAPTGRPRPTAYPASDGAARASTAWALQTISSRPRQAAR